jgi:hypothetical protein
MDDENTGLAEPGAANGDARLLASNTPAGEGPSRKMKGPWIDRPLLEGTEPAHNLTDRQLEVGHLDTAPEGGQRDGARAPQRGTFQRTAGTTQPNHGLVRGHRATGQWRTVYRALGQQQAAGVATSHQPPLVSAGLQILLGYAWLLAGVDKILLGNFPAQLDQILTGSLRGGRLPGPFADFLRAVVLPNGAIFGLMDEYGEALAGLGLIAAGLAILFAAPIERRLAPKAAHWVAPARRALVSLGLLAALGAALLGVTYYLLDGAPWQGFMPSVAFNGALDPGLFLALGSLVLLTEPIHAWLQGRSQRRQVSPVPVRREGSNRQR